MSRRAIFASTTVTLFLICQVGRADSFMRGKVTMEDGSPPPGPVLIQRVCPGANAQKEGATDKRGYYLWRVLRRTEGGAEDVCLLKAVLTGYHSTTIDTSQESLYFSLDLPALILRPSNAAAAADENPKLPRAAAKLWDLGMKAVAAKSWVEAEALLRKTVQAAPDFAPAWNSLGAACQNQQKTGDAREAYRHAIQLDRGMLLAHLNLTRLEISSRDWPEAVNAAEALIQADTEHRYLEAYLHEVIARYALHDLIGAAATLAAALPLDKRHELPQLEYYQGAVLSANGDREGAAEHLRKYLALTPGADDTSAVRSFLENLDADNQALPLSTQNALVPSPVDSNLPAVGDAWVPGGLKALAAMAHVKAAPSSENFFMEYCRAIAAETSKTNDVRTPGYGANLEAYLAAVADLTRLGEQRGDKTTMITISLADSANIAKAQQILARLGWTVVEEDGTVRVAPGEQSADGPRQLIPAAFGIDELAMQRDLESGKSFGFEIPSERAGLIGGVAWWGGMVQSFAGLPGGLAEAFERDPRLAKTYAALAAMPADAAKALVAPLGLRLLTGDYSEPLWLYSDRFRVANGVVAVPGGAEAEKVWSKLAGANPHDPSGFFPALLAADRGRLAAFYSALAHADSAHQRFFLRSLARAQRFYTWYRDSDELRGGIGRPARSWRPEFFQELPLDDRGEVRFPGGKGVWTNSSTSDEDALLHLNSAEELLAVARLEQKRGGPFDAASARIVARHVNEWRPLFPYFEVLGGLGKPEFEALERFSKTVAGYRKPMQNLVTGEWYSLVALIVEGRKAGSLDDATSVRAFRETCEGLLADDYSAKAMAVLREIAGAPAGLDDAVTEKLLRLDGGKRAAFERVRELQGAPRLDALGASPGPERTLAALAGLVYGAMVDPDSLLVSEDPNLMSRHQFVPDACTSCSSSSLEKTRVFDDAKLFRSVASGGTRITGGFMHFEGVAQSLRPGAAMGTPGPARPERSSAEGIAPSLLPVAAVKALGPDRPEGSGPREGGAAAPAEGVFRANARLVQVFATITDSRGRYVDGLGRDQFTVLDNGQPVPIAAFENEAVDVSWALLLDTTESMQASLPAVKRAALELIGRLRANDSVAVYALSGGITELQPFTMEKDAAARAVLRTKPSGMTALYDGLVRVVRDIAGRPGKKAIVVLTDGDDNISTLPAETAIQRAKAAGVPIYTIAKGADPHQQAVQALAVISRSTGGMTLTPSSSSDILNAFERVFQDLMHGYVLAFQPPGVEGHNWRSIEVVLKDSRGRKVRARDGYYPE
jgi:Ca-activated chloride channel family protein